MIDALFTVTVYAALAFAVLGGVIVLTALAFWLWDHLMGEPYIGYDDIVDESPWEDWDYPIPDDNDEWDFPRKDAA